MRWDNLFDDLEGQLEQELSADELDQRAEEERLRIGRLSLRDRLLALHESYGGRDYAIAIALRSGERISVRATSFGRDWFVAQLVGDQRRRRQCVIPLTGIAAVMLSREQSEVSLAPITSEAGAHSLSARLTLPFVLRDLCRRRSAVDVRTVLGDAHGTIDRVGRDHLDLAVHEAGSPRRAAAVSEYRTVPFEQLLMVRI